MTKEVIKQVGMEKVWLYGSILFISTGTFVSQIILSHTLGVIFHYDFRFLSVPVALFGLGAGGIAALMFLGRETNWVRKNIIWSSALYAATTVLPFFYIKAKGFGGSKSTYAFIVIFALTFFNFFLAGLVKTIVYITHKDLVYKFYFFDLLGVAVASGVTLLVADLSGIYSTVYLLFIFGLTGFLCCLKYYSQDLSVKIILLVLAAVLFSIVIVCRTSFVLEYPTSRQDKIREGSNSFSQVSMFKAKANPAYLMFEIVINSYFNTYGYIAQNIEGLRGRIADAGNVAFEFRHYDKALIVGSGAGVDLSRALLANVKEITAIEINPLIVKFANSFPIKLGKSAYQDARVTTVIAEARSYIGGSIKKFDLIFISHVKNFGQPVGAQLFVPKHLYTIEAFKTYADKLETNGVLVVKDYADFMRQYLKTFATLARQDGLSIEKHLVFLSETGSREELLMFKPDGFSETEMRDLLTVAGKHKLVLHQDLTREIDLLDPKVLTDDNPFLWQSGSKDQVRYPLYAIPAKKILKHFLVLVQWSVGCVFAVVVLFLWNSRSKRKDSLISLFLIGISVGLAALQFVLINKVTLLLGNPVYAQALLLSLFLLSGGVGSLMASKKEVGAHLWRISFLVVLIMATYYFLLDQVITVLMPAGDLLKVVVVTLIIAIPGFFSGMLFPIAFDRIGTKDVRSLSWVLAIDALAFVAAGLIFSFLVLFFGNRMLLVFGALGYAFAAFAVKYLEW